MPDETIRELIGSTRTRFHAELDAQLEAITVAHEQALAAARREAETAADERWSTVLAESVTQATREQEAAIAAARDDRDSERARRVLRDTRLAQGLRELEATSSLIDALRVILRAASDQAPGVRLFLAGAHAPREWADPSAADGNAPGGAAEEAPPLVREAAQTAGSVRDGSDVAVPLTLDGVAVAVLHATGVKGDPRVEEWRPTLEVIARSGAARLGYLTALRTARALRWFSADAQVSAAGSPLTNPDSAPLQ